uniref:Uncharacterized protein n=1 Tax=Caenorhabditis japonica TaxID=281687 RepID=A0A8R1ELT0_CAEJA
MVPPSKEKLLKKKKKKKKLMRRMEEEAALGRRARNDQVLNEFQGIDGVWRAVPDEQGANGAQNDSTESGQESDIQKTPQTDENAQKKKKVVDGFELEANEVLAAAFNPLDALEARFLRVEAYGTHGYRSDAIDYSLKIVEYLIDSLTEQSNEFRKIDEILDNMPSTSSKPISSSSSAVSYEAIGADREEEVARTDRFLTTMERILYVTKVLKDSPHLQRTVFDISMRTLSVTKWPSFTRYQQVVAAYLVSF